MSDVTPPEPTPAAPAGDPVPVPEPETSAPESTGGEGGARDAEIAELKRQIEAAAPILKAHADAEEANKTELQKAQDRAAQLEADLTASREVAARANVAAKTGLSPEIVALLQGADEAALMAAAEKVKAVSVPPPASPNLRQRPSPVVGGKGGQAGGESDVPDPAKLAAQIRAQMPY